MSQEAEQRAMAWWRNLDYRDLGSVAEKLWARVIDSVGARYIPLCSINTGRAPVLSGRRPVVLPDYEVHADVGQRVYLEVKGKRKRGIFCKAGNEPRQCIDKRKLHHYQDIVSLNLQHVALGIFECFEDYDLQSWSGRFLIQSLHVLGKPTAGTSETTGLVFWPVSRFVTVCRMKPETAMGDDQFPESAIESIRTNLKPFLSETSVSPVQRAFV